MVSLDMLVDVLISIGTKDHFVVVGMWALVVVTEVTNYCSKVGREDFLLVNLSSSWIWYDKGVIVVHTLLFTLLT